jgi:DHHC palmitoyltransferase
MMRLVLTHLNLSISVGYFNYRYFVNFLIQIFIGMTYGTAVMLEPFLFAKSPEYRSQVALQRRAIKEGFTAERLQPMVPFREEKMLLTLSFMLCAAVGIAILILGGFHVYLTCTAQTTIEFHGNWAARKRARAAGQKWKNPYSQGSCMANWQQVYGTGNLLLSLLPSLREPEFLPVPMPGHTGRRMGKPTNVDKGGDESVIPCDAPTGLSGGLKAASLV